MAVILGIISSWTREDVAGFKGSSRIFLKEVPDANRFGVAELEGDRVIGIEKKPKVPKSEGLVDVRAD